MIHVYFGRSIIGICSMLLLLPIIVHSQSGGVPVRVFPAEGLMEISGSVSYSRISLVHNNVAGDPVTEINIAPQIGYFLTDNFELGLSPGITSFGGVPPGYNSSSFDDEHQTFIQIFFSPSLNFPFKKHDTFFIEGDLGYASNSSNFSIYNKSGLSYGGRIGLKVISGAHVLITPSVQYIVLNLNRAGEEGHGYKCFSIGIGVGGVF